MPTKPEVQEMETNGAKIAAAVRSEMGEEFQSQVPAIVMEGDTLPNGRIATQADSLASLRDFGAALFTFTPRLNDFMDALVNRIGRVVFNSRLYSNPLAFFKRGYLDYGETIEEIATGLVDAMEFDPVLAQSTVFQRKIPNVYTAFHTVNYKKWYKTTTSRTQLRAAFLSFEGLNTLINQIIGSMVKSAEYDENIMMRFLIANAALGGRMYPETVGVATLSNADEIAAQLKTMSANIADMSTLYNYANIPTYTDRSSQYLIMTNKFAATMDVGSLARAFNMEKVEFMGHSLTIRSFDFNAAEESRLANLLFQDPAKKVFTDAEHTLLQEIAGVLVDRDWFMIYDNLLETDSIKNPDSLEWNNTYHTWKIFSTSPFNTAVCFTTTPNAVTGITVSPTAVSAAKGSLVQFTADVATDGFGAQGVNWSVNSTLSSIDYTGRLKIGLNETATELTVTATSAADSAFSAQATVTITG